MAQEVKNRILLVEDDADSRFALAMLFELEGYEVITAANGLEAYRRAVSDCPDLIVTDINMPGGNGLDLIRMVRGDERTESIPVIVMSAVEKQYLNQALELGAIAVAQKPLEVDQLLSLIARLISTRHLLTHSHAQSEGWHPQKITSDLVAR